MHPAVSAKSASTAPRRGPVARRRPAPAPHARVDNRVMFSVGRAARSLGLLGASVTLVLGIPLSVSGKSPFFDRKPKK